MKVDLAPHVDKQMTEEERQLFLAHFSKSRWHGAHVADILDAMLNEDAHLDITSPLLLHHADEIVPYPVGLFTVCVYVGMYTGKGADWPTVKELMDRFKP